MADLKPCPFCGGEASSCLDPNHSTGWDVGCFSGTCDIEPHVWAVHHATAIDQWNTRTPAPEAVDVRESLDYILDGMGISGPDYVIDPDDDFEDAANSKWVKDTLTRLAVILRALAAGGE